MQIIGYIHSPYAQKFGIPRQAGLVPAARARVFLEAEFAPLEALRGLADCSHIWLIWQAHAAEGWRPTVRPPRLGGNRRMGVYASRSPFRPNPLGLSAVRLEAIREGPPATLEISGGDFLDGTPVLDIKPYLPWADAIPEADGGFGGQAPRQVLPVRFSDTAQRQSASLPQGTAALIRQTLACDPRPAYHSETGRRYGMRLAGYEVRWHMEGGAAVVERIEPEEGLP